MLQIINVINCENIKICGEGEIDSNALNVDWYIDHRVKNIAWTCSLSAITLFAIILICTFIGIFKKNKKPQKRL